MREGVEREALGAEWRVGWVEAGACCAQSVGEEGHSLQSPWRVLGEVVVWRRGRAVHEWLAWGKGEQKDCREQQELHFRRQKESRKGRCMGRRGHRELAEHAGQCTMFSATQEAMDGGTQ